MFKKSSPNSPKIGPPYMPLTIKTQLLLCIIKFIIARLITNLFEGVRRVLCLNYLAGFCPKGPDCPDTHPKFELPPLGGPDDPRGFGKKIIITCHYCGEPGHKVSSCTKVPPEIREQHLQV